jgi:hypothetical protein
MPWSRFSTLTCSPADRNMVEPACGPCHWRQVSGRTWHIWLSLSWPSLSSLKARWAVIIFAIEAGGMRRSGSLE